MVDILILTGRFAIKRAAINISRYVYGSYH
jgi:hypothetical protein